MIAAMWLAVAGIWAVAIGLGVCVWYLKKAIWEISILSECAWGFTNGGDPMWRHTQ